jgi:hypothetical protein
MGVGVFDGQALGNGGRIEFDVRRKENEGAEALATSASFTSKAAARCTAS